MSVRYYDIFVYVGFNGIYRKNDLEIKFFFIYYVNEYIAVCRIVYTVFFSLIIIFFCCKEEKKSVILSY